MSQENKLNLSLGYFLKSWRSRVLAEHPVLIGRGQQRRTLSRGGMRRVFVIQYFPRESLEHDCKWPEGSRWDPGHTRGSQNGKSWATSRRDGEELNGPQFSPQSWEMEGCPLGVLSHSCELGVSKQKLSQLLIKFALLKNGISFIFLVN